MQGKKAEKDIVPKHLALPLGVFLIILLLVALYFLFSIVAPPREMQVGNASAAHSLLSMLNATPSQNFSMPSMEYRPDLMGEYGIRATPTLVINCRYARVGSLAYDEARGNYPKGSERNDLVNAICKATGALCAQSTGEPEVSLRDTGRADCGAGKVVVYAFYSLFCSYSGAQFPVLSSLEKEFPDNVKVIYIVATQFS